MPFIGNAPSNNFVSLKRQDITGDGTASYTLDYKVASVNDVLIYVNHVKQDPSSYSISNTSLTMGGNVASTDDFYIIYLGQGLQTVTPADNTITTSMVQDNAITDAKINASLGKVLQVVTATDTGNYTISSTTFVNSSNGLSVSITPSSTSNKILVMASISLMYSESGQNFLLTIYRDSTNLGGTNGLALHTGFNEGTPAAFHYLDSPSTTSATTYQIYSKVTGGSSSNYGNTNAPSSITAMEIAG